jgi:hypothetical protein
VSNGKELTLISYLYLLIGAVVLWYGNVAAAMFCAILAELARVDKPSRVANVTLTDEILNGGGMDGEE